MLDWVDLTRADWAMDETNQKSAPSTDAVYRFGLFSWMLRRVALPHGLRIRLQDQPFQLLRFAS